MFLYKETLHVIIEFEILREKYHDFISHFRIFDIKEYKPTIYNQIDPNFIFFKIYMNIILPNKMFSIFAHHSSPFIAKIKPSITNSLQPL